MQRSRSAIRAARNRSRSAGVTRGLSTFEEVRRRRAIGPGAQAGTLRMTASSSYRHRGGIALARARSGPSAAARDRCAAAVERHGHDRGQAAAVVLADADDAAAALTQGGDEHDRAVHGPVGGAPTAVGRDDLRRLTPGAFGAGAGGDLDGEAMRVALARPRLRGGGGRRGGGDGHHERGQRGERGERGACQDVASVRPPPPVGRWVGAVWCGRMGPPSNPRSAPPETGRTEVIVLGGGSAPALQAGSGGRPSRGRAEAP